ncbi:MAG: type IV pilin-like G/H family protein, partial [Cyanobacteriota bacterium]|nr:type IV pilin-like G/H family protein [Cyanobacteriota bacterium]
MGIEVEGRRGPLASFPALFAYSFCYEPPFQSFEELQGDEELSDFGVAFANLEGANLTGADLSNAVLIAANLKNANLSGANLTKTCLTYSQFHNATLDGANLKEAQLYGAVFENASLRNVQNADLSEAYRTERDAKLVVLQSQAKRNLGSMNRAQQAYYIEHEQFATVLDDLGIGIPADTEFYRFEILPQPDRAQSVMMVAIAKIEGLKSYTG